MKRIVFTAALMILAVTGVANGQNVNADANAAAVDELRRALADRQGAEAMAADAWATELQNAFAERQWAVADIAQAGLLQSFPEAFLATRGDPVSYRISGRLPAAGSSSSPLPVEIVSAIRSDSHLKQMNIGSGSNALRVANGATAWDDRPTFNAAFGFQTLDEFNTWYSAQGEALHRAIDRAGAENVQFNLSVVPAE